MPNGIIEAYVPHIQHNQLRGHGMSEAYPHLFRLIQPPFRLECIWVREDARNTMNGPCLRADDSAYDNQPEPSVNQSTSERENMFWWLPAGILYPLIMNSPARDSGTTRSSIEGPEPYNRSAKRSPSDITFAGYIERKAYIL